MTKTTARTIKDYFAQIPNNGLINLAYFLSFEEIAYNQSPLQSIKDYFGKVNYEVSLDKIENWEATLEDSFRDFGYTSQQVEHIMLLLMDFFDDTPLEVWQISIDPEDYYKYNRLSWIDFLFKKANQLFYLVIEISD